MAHSAMVPDDNPVQWEILNEGASDIQAPPCESEFVVIKNYAPIAGDAYALGENASLPTYVILI